MRDLTLVHPRATHNVMLTSYSIFALTQTEGVSLLEYEGRRKDGGGRECPGLSPWPSQRKARPFTEDPPSL